MNFHFTVLLVLISLSLPVLAKEPKKSISADASVRQVLFIGNSYSYFNNGLHSHYSNLIKASGRWQKDQDYNRLKTLSSGRLVEHLPDLKIMLKEPGARRWDAVVLQEHSTGAISRKHRQGFASALTQSVDAIRGSGAEPILFMTWPYRNRSGMQEQLIAAYENAARTLQLRVAPVALAFSQVRSLYPGIELYHPDIGGFDDNGDVRFAKTIRHPSLAGTYLTACVFYALLQGKSPQGLVYDPGLNDGEAMLLQKIAWQVVRDYAQPVNNRQEKS